MKRKHLLSAVLAVLMVLSMVAMIVLPTGAEVDLSSVPSVSTCKGSNSAAQSFKISTPEELIYAAAHPTYFSNGDTLYIANDIDCAAYGPSFGEEFLNFNPAQDGRTEMNIVFDGLGHTISNFVDDFPFFGGRQVNEIRNLNFDNSSVVNMDPTVYAYGILLRSVERDVLIENCHIRNSYVYSAYPMYNAIFVPLINNNPGKNLTMVNCSVYNCELRVDASSVSASGLFVGRYGASGKLVIKNCIAADSVISGSVSASTSQGTGFILGELYNSNYDEHATFENVGVFGCKHEFPNSTSAATAPIAVSKKGNNNQSLTYNNVYAAGNVHSNDPNSSEDDVPMDEIFYHAGGDTTYSQGNAYGSPDVKYALYSKDILPSVEIPEEHIDPTFSMGAAMLLMNKVEAAEEDKVPYDDWGIGLVNEPVILEGKKGLPMKQTFVHADGTEEAFYTNVEGGLVADRVAFQLLRKVSWRDQNNVDYMAKKVHWDMLSFDKAMTFTEHDVDVVSNGDGTHSVFCYTSDSCVDHVDSVPCRGFAVGTEESGYYGEDAVVYECTVCGYRWKDYISDAVSPAPLTLTLNKEEFEAGEEIIATVSRSDNTNLAGFAFLIEYDASVLDLNAMNPLDGRYILKGETVGTGVESVVMIQNNGIAINNAGDLLTFSFTAREGIKDDVESLINMYVVQAVTKTASGAEAVDVIQSMLVNNAIIYAAFTEGDVNADGAVDLLDVILLMEKLNGVMDSADEEDFIKRAANVDGDAENQVNTADITYLLRHLADWAENATLVRSEPNPELIA